MLVEETCIALRREIGKVVAGQAAVVDQILVAVLSNGHILLEGVPGVAKTLMVRTVAKTLSIPYGRIQFTPDLMPSDVLGTNVFDQKLSDFKVKQGPIFVGMLLADEINRTPPKTQAALLEAMEEKHVTIDGTEYPLPEPFIVLATQNPIDFEGTYPLPEAQQDRFLLKVVVQYPDFDAEIAVLKSHHRGFSPQHLEQAGVGAVTDLNGIKQMKAEVQAVKVEDKIFDYIYTIVRATRQSNEVLVGASPRAGIALLNCSKAIAAMRGRDFVIPDDVKEFAIPILRHRVLLRPEAEIEGLTLESHLRSLVESQPVPR